MWALERQVLQLDDRRLQVRQSERGVVTAWQRDTHM